MKAKEYMRQVQKLDKLIENKMAEKAQWKSIALNITPSMEVDKVQSSSSQQKMADAMNRYIDLDKEIDEYIDKLVDAKKEVLATIEQLKAIEYDILHKVYVQYCSLDEVAIMYDKSYSWATTMHGEALKSVQMILNRR